MDAETKLSGQTKKEENWLRYREIGFGYLYLNVRGYEMRFDDECDRIPDFIDIYNHLKNGECGDWRIWDEEDIWIAFTAPEQRKNIVYLSAGAEGTYSSITRVYFRKEILQMLKNVFKSLLMDKDFPYQYPCFDELDEAMCEKAQDEAEMQAKGNSDLEDELYKAACREGRVLLTPAGKEHYLRYKKMLEDCINS